MKKIFLICLTLFLPVVTWADDELAPNDMNKRIVETRNIRTGNPIIRM